MKEETKRNIIWMLEEIQEGKTSFAKNELEKNDNKAEFAFEINDIIEAIKQDASGVIAVLDEFLNGLAHQMLNDGFCPKCGEKLDDEGVCGLCGGSYGQR